MDNTNNEASTQQGSENMQGFFAAYKKQKEVKKKLSKDEMLAKYFSPRNDKEYFRALPPLTKSNPPRPEDYFPTAHFHVLRVGKIWKKIYCPAHNESKIQAIDKDGKPVFDQNNKPVLVSVPCALCKKAKTLLATQDRSLLAKTKGKKKEELEKELTSDEKRIVAKNKEIYTEASKLEAKKFYILRGIDKGKDKDGVKFWRFKHNFKNQGIYDKIMAATEEFSMQHGDFTDVEKGTDLSIVVVDSQIPNTNIYFKDVSAIIPRGSSKLNNDPMILKQWLDDKTTWKDVYKPAVAPNITSGEYLELAAEGNAPYFDESDPKNKKWIFPNHPDLEEKANTRDKKLDADSDDEYGNYDEETESVASSVVGDSYKNDITTITDKDVKEFKHGSEDIGVKQTSKTEAEPEYGDLPF